MKLFTSIALLVAAFLAVFWSAAFGLFREYLGAQVDLLPPLMIYAGLTCGLGTVAMTACLGGLWFDSLSVNPLGVSVVPLFAVGLLAHFAREFVLREQTFTQVTFGAIAGAAAPFLTIVLLLTIGQKPLLGWGSLWQWLVMTAGAAVATPVFFLFFEWVHRTFVHHHVHESSFRPDREIRRGR